MKNLYFLLVFSMLSGIVTGQPAFNWTSKEIKAGSNLKKMTVSNNQAVIAGYGRTFVKSGDNGAVWSDAGLLSTLFDFNSMSFKGINGYIAGNRSKIFDAYPDPYTNGIILKTADAGYTWTNVPLTALGSGDDPALAPSALKSYGLDFQMVGCASSSVVYCALRWLEFKPDTVNGYREHSGIFKSADKGGTWKNISGDLKGAVITAFACYDTTCYIGGNKKLYKTSTNSETLTDIFANLNAGATAYINDIQAVTKDELYVITTTSGAFSSVNGGTTFTKYNISGITGGQDLAKVDNNTLVLTGTSGKSRVSRDAGVTWEDAKLAVAIWEVGGVFGDSLYVLAKSDVYKIKMSDLNSGNYTWVKQAICQDNIHKMHVLDEDNAILVGLGQTFKKTGNKGKTWSDIPLPSVPLYDADLNFDGLRNIKDTAFASVNRFYFIDYPSTSPLSDIYWSGGIFKTTDNWATWSILDAALIGAAEGTDPSKNPQLGVCNGFNPTVIEYAGGNVILVWARWYDYSGATRAEHSRVFRSADAGKIWKVVSDDFGGSNYVMDIKFNGNTGYVAGNKILLKSTDKGLTFTDIYPALKSAAGGADQFINAITLRPGNELLLTTVTAVLRSVDGGATFTKLPVTTGGNDLFAFNNTSWMVMGTSTKSLYTENSGTTWQTCSPGATIYGFGVVWNDNIYALGRGLYYKMPVADLKLTSSPAVSNPGELMVRYTPVSVELVSPDQVISRCQVYSVTGQLISDTAPRANQMELLNQQFKPGIYFVRSQAGNRLFINKIIFR